MLKSQINPMPQYFDRYIALTDDVEMLDAIQISLDEIDQFPIAKWKAHGDNVYAPGKWTIKDILQHMIDTERVMTYRMTAAARGDQQTMLPFDEDAYAANADTGRRTLEDLIAELKLQRLSFQAMCTSFSEAMLQRICKGYNSDYSVGAIGFMVPGHQRWHMRVIKERYF